MSWTTADGIRVYSRADWGARPPKGRYGALGPLRSVVVHHGGPVGAPPKTFATASARLRSFQAYHMDEHGWTDIGYHLAIDGLGRVYQCRPIGAMGAHVAMQNTGRIGIVFLQDGRNYKLTRQQRKTLKKLARKPHHRLGLPALDSVTVLGHREVPGQSTECPGALISRGWKRIVR